FLQLEQFQLLEAGIQDAQQSIRDRDADACQLAIGTNYRGLFGEELIPAAADVFKLLLQRKPHVLLPVQAVFDRVAILHHCFLEILSHFARMGSAKGGHLAIPPRAEVPTKAVKPEELAQGEKMLEKARSRVVHFRLVQELAPGLVREQGEGTQLAAGLKMREDFAGDAFQLFRRGAVGSLRSVLDE